MQQNKNENVLRRLNPSILVSEIAGFIKNVWFQVCFVALKANKFKLDNYSVIVNFLPFLLNCFFYGFYYLRKCWVFWIVRRKSDNSNNENTFLFLSLGRNGLLVYNEAYKANDV